MNAEEIARAYIANEINSLKAEREKLANLHGQVWDTNEMTEQFEVLGFAAPVVVVRRKSDGKRGSLYFQHWPRFYFSLSEG